jgi:hypothetical protein
VPGKVLFIAVGFPPLGGSGVQRTSKFAKHPSACGREVMALTAGPPRESVLAVAGSLEA